MFIVGTQNDYLFWEICIRWISDSIVDSDSDSICLEPRSELQSSKPRDPTSFHATCTILGYPIAKSTIAQPILVVILPRLLSQRVRRQCLGVNTKPTATMNANGPGYIPHYNYPKPWKSWRSRLAPIRRSSLQLNSMDCWSCHKVFANPSP